VTEPNAFVTWSSRISAIPRDGIDQLGETQGLRRHKLPNWY
jgi:hypothetical protein